MSTFSANFHFGVNYSLNIYNTLETQCYLSSFLSKSSKADISKGISGHLSDVSVFVPLLPHIVLWFDGLIAVLDLWVTTLTNPLPVNSNPCYPHMSYSPTTRAEHILSECCWTTHRMKQECIDVIFSWPLVNRTSYIDVKWSCINIWCWIKFEMIFTEKLLVNFTNNYKGMRSNTLN